MKDLYKYDVLRVDRSISNHGLESRVPFLDIDFVDLLFKIPAEFKHPKFFNIEKGLFRKAFEDSNLLPKQVLFRKKEAFSDGVSNEEKSWYQVLQEHLNTIISDEEFNQNKDKFDPTPPNKEAYYFRKKYKEYFGNNKLIDYYWLPKWCGENKEPSARVLNVYKNEKVSSTFSA
jgi:asparagine synthase (glutamine-hydrolysing)